MIPVQTLHAIDEWVSSCQRPLLLSHRRPDGDAIGSLAAMALLLRARGQTPQVALFDHIPARYAMLQTAAEWRSWEESRELLVEGCDAVIVLDTCSLSQLEPAAEFLANAPRTLVIDHHLTRDPIGTRDGDMQAIDETAGANALILAEWARAAGRSLDEPTARALFVGLATDTGWFRYSNTDARMLRAAADLLDAGVDAAALYNAIYQQEPAAKLRLIAQLLQSLELRAEGRLAVMCLRPADFARAGADRTMTEDLVNEAGRIAGVECTLLFTEEDSGEVRVNLRSREQVDVAAIARRFGGGGHARAAGCRLRGGWDREVPRFIADVIETL
ncbi:MAG: DHH family phosphoesterase [Planctomycetes bacterium]|nr:DHH family phosphoesterase [Planctomycetota bacterium]